MNVWKGAKMILAIKIIGTIVGVLLLTVLGTAVYDAIQNRHSTSDNPKYSMVEKCDETGGDLTFFQKENKGVYTVEVWQNFYTEDKAKLRICYKTQKPITCVADVSILFEGVRKDDASK